MSGWRNLGLWIGAVIVGGTLLVAVFAPLLAGHDPFAQDLARRLMPPMWMEGGTAENLLGTDQLGRDYLARLIYGARISMLIGIMTVVTSGLIGVTLGVVGGFFGGRIDDAVLFTITARLSIPLILVALAVVSLIGSSMVVVVATLGLFLSQHGSVRERRGPHLHRLRRDARLGQQPERPQRSPQRESALERRAREPRPL